MSEENIHKKYQLARFGDIVESVMEYLKDNKIGGSNLYYELSKVKDELVRTKAILDGKHNLVLPEELHDKVYNELADWMVEGRNYGS